MENVVLIVHLILALCLVGVVLLQRSEGGGLGLGGGGGGGGVMSGRQAATALAKLTWLFAAAFICTSITLTVFSAQNAAGRSVIDAVGAPATGTAPLAPIAPGGDLLPPDTAPSPAPRVD
jgi:preprotein translocase subunit SecG